MSVCLRKSRSFTFLFHRLKRIVHRGMATLETLEFENLALKKLPIDTEKKNYVRTVAEACFSLVTPTPLKNPQLVAVSTSAMNLIDLSSTEISRPEFVEYFSGNKLLPGSQTAAHCYCGHQFGYFSGQLGDGAAIYLGEVLNKSRERWEIQLKGAGMTPYSRDADGRKVLRSSVREFLCSEAMHFLGIPTTRAGVCITSDSTVYRDMFYDGHPRHEKCTVILRLAPTFLRFGSFEIFKTLDPHTGRVGPSVGRHGILQNMLDYSVETFFPEIYKMHKANQLEMYKSFYKEVVLRTAKLVSDWQCIGFCHGVLNTDNMSIMGLTIDYGPFGFLDRYDPDHICNNSDDGGRYTYVKQPEICEWNLRKFAEAIKHFLPLTESLPILEALYNAEFERNYMRKMREKLGLLRKELPEDKNVIKSLLETMEATGADFTNTFRSLSTMSLPGLDDAIDAKAKLLEKLMAQCSSLEELIRSFESSMDQRQFQLLVMLMNTNPELLEQLGKGAATMQRIMTRMERAAKLKELTVEEKEASDREKWKEFLDLYEERLQKECEQNQDGLEAYQAERVETMNNTNPRFVLRNYVAQRAIEKAEKGDFGEVRRVLKILETPFADDLPDFDASADGENVPVSDETPGSTMTSMYDGRPPAWACGLKVSCSS